MISMWERSRALNISTTYVTTDFRSKLKLKESNMRNGKFRMTGPYPNIGELGKYWAGISNSASQWENEEASTKRNQGWLRRWMFAYIMMLKGISSSQFGLGWPRFSFKTEWEVWNSERRAQFQWLYRNERSSGTQYQVGS